MSVAFAATNTRDRSGGRGKGQGVDDRYHFIVPSLAGWAYSSPPPLDREFAVKDIAKIINGLMVGLGFDKYIAQGGDIGSMVAVDLGVNHDACSGKSSLHRFFIFPRALIRKRFRIDGAKVPLLDRYG